MPECKKKGYCIYQRSAENIGKIFDRSSEKGKVLTGQKVK